MDYNTTLQIKFEKHIKIQLGVDLWQQLVEQNERVRICTQTINVRPVDIDGWINSISIFPNQIGHDDQIQSTICIKHFKTNKDVIHTKIIVWNSKLVATYEGDLSLETPCVMSTAWNIAYNGCQIFNDTFGYIFTKWVTNSFGDSIGDIDIAAYPCISRPCLTSCGRFMYNTLTPNNCKIMYSQQYQCTKNIFLPMCLKKHTYMPYDTCVDISDGKYILAKYIILLEHIISKYVPSDITTVIVNFMVQLE